MSGLTEEGFVAETFQSLRASIHGRLRAVFDAGLPLDESTIEGQSWDILIERLVKIWELGQTVYSSQDPDKATGAALDALCLLTGTFRQPASYSQGTTILVGDVDTPVAAGTQVRIGSEGSVSVTYEAATLASATAWATSTAYTEGDIVTANGQVYWCHTGETSASSGTGPSHTSRPASIASPLELDDGTTIDVDNDSPSADGVIWIWVGEGEAYAEVATIATETGPVNFPAFAIDQIVTPVVGLNAVGNAEDFDIGKDVMSDEELRDARERNLSGPGTGTVDAIASAVLGCDQDIVSVTVFVNNGDEEDADGLPPHSVEVLVRGGDDQKIIDCLLANVGAGIATFGNTSGFAVDSMGTSHPIKFTRPTEIPVYVAITLTYDEDDYPEDGDDAVAQEIVDFGDAQDTGKDAIAWSVGACAREVDGVLKVSSCFIGTAPAPVSSADIVITKRQLAVFDTARITVASSADEP